MPERKLEGQVALVTGAGRGLGRAFAERLAALGCPVGVHGMREKGPAEYGEGTTLTETARTIGEIHGVRTCRVLGDLTHGAEVERVVATVEAELGPVEVLVHNAGGDIGARGGKPDPNDAVGIREEDVRAVLECNLLSTILVCQRVARSMMERRRGRMLTRVVDPKRPAETGTLDRTAMVDEVARVVEFFAGPLGGFVSGQVLRVDGGGQCWPG